MSRHTFFIPTLALCAALVGCDAAPETDAMQQEAPAAAEPAAVMAQPDTTAAALWSHLQEMDYANAWSFWPDREPFYQGGEPHGMLLNTYLNDAAFDAVVGADPASALELPAGAIIVKENYQPDSTLAATTVMHKVDGYAPDAGDWFWAKYGPDGAVQAAGHAQGCIACHGQASERYDYLMTARADADGDN